MAETGTTGQDSGRDAGQNLGHDDGHDVGPGAGTGSASVPVAEPDNRYGEDGVAECETPPGCSGFPMATRKPTVAAGFAEI